jgi:hypothetical protein
MTESLIGCVREEVSAFRENESDLKAESLNHIDLGGILVRNRCGSQSGEPQYGSA